MSKIFPVNINTQAHLLHHSFLLKKKMSIYLRARGIGGCGGGSQSCPPWKRLSAGTEVAGIAKYAFATTQFLISSSLFLHHCSGLSWGGMQGSLMLLVCRNPIQLKWLELHLAGMDLLLPSITSDHFLHRYKEVLSRPDPHEEDVGSGAAPSAVWAG